MKNDKNKISSSGKPNGQDDEIIGAALSRGLARSGKIRTDQCPGPGEIAAVVEGNASAGEKDRILKHVNACTDCYEMFLLTVELHNDEERVENIEPVEEMDIVPKREYSHKIFSWRPMALAASILIMAFSLYLLLYRGSEIPKTPGELLEKTAALKEYQTPAPQGQLPGMPYQAKAKINTEADAGKVVQSAPPPPPPAKTQPVETKTFQNTGASGASPEMMMERHREQVEKEEAPTGATALLGTPQSSASKLGRLETDNEAGVSESAKSGEDAWQDKKDMPLQQQALILNQQVQAENNYISRAELAELLNNTILLAQQMGKEFTVLRKESVKNRDLKKSDSYINGLKPLMTMKVVADNAYIMPDLEWFFSRSQPGTVEYSFFSLARSGWCVAAGSCTIGKIDRPEAQKLRIRWQTLEPQLTGIFKQIADYTIEHLDSQ